MDFFNQFIFVCAKRNKIRLRKDMIDTLFKLKNVTTYYIFEYFICPYYVYKTIFYSKRIDISIVVFTEIHFESAFIHA